MNFHLFVKDTFLYWQKKGMDIFIVNPWHLSSFHIRGLLDKQNPHQINLTQLPKHSPMAER